jgi:predicted RecA/RadA family phage recombinase
MKNYVQDGDTLPVTAAADTDPGAVVVQGKLIGISVTGAANGEEMQVRTNGVFELAKTSAQAWTQGAEIYVTPGGLATTASSGNTKIGYAAAAAANPSSTGHVKIGATL